MMKIAPKLAIAAAVLALASPALAKEKGEGKGKGGGPAKQFERFDRNNDGAVDADEIKQRLSKFLKRADANNDAVIDADEIKSIKEKAGAKNAKSAENIDKKIRKLDTDGDGKITETEALTRPGWFDKADKDGDGKVTKAEIDDLVAKRGARDAAKAENAKAKDDPAKAEGDPAAKTDDDDMDDRPVRGASAGLSNGFV